MLARPKAIAVLTVTTFGLIAVPAASAKKTVQGTLQLGSRGAAVRTLQRDLTEVGVATGVTGRFNRITRRNVIEFQTESDISADGVVGPQTFRALNKAIAADSAAAATASAAAASDGFSGGAGLNPGSSTSTSTSASTSTGGSTSTTPAATETLATGVTPAIKLTLNSQGLVNIPSGIPTQMAALLAAGNAIAKNPYVYGGGHQDGWPATTLNSGYDCSGSVSYVLHAAGLMNATQGDSDLLPEDSIQFETYGDPGAGLSGWVTMWTNSWHVYLHVANLWFDTVALQENGDRWSTTRVSSATSFIERHPTGW